MRNRVFYKSSISIFSEIEDPSPETTRPYLVAIASTFEACGSLRCQDCKLVDQWMALILEAVVLKVFVPGLWVPVLLRRSISLRI